MALTVNMLMTKPGFVTITLIVLAHSLAAQPPARPNMNDASAGAIVVAAKNEGPGGFRSYWLQDIMRQGSRQPRAKLDAIADSMANVVIRGSKNPSDSNSIYAVATLSALVATGLNDGAAGSPYDGVLDRLIRIHREGSEGFGGSALRAMTKVPGYARALRYLHDAASDTGLTALSAVNALHQDVVLGFSIVQKTPAEREEAKAVLRDLFVTKSIRNPVAAEVMANIANQYGWR